MVGNEEETIYFAVDSDVVINLVYAHHYFPGGRDGKPMSYETAKALSRQSIISAYSEIMFAYENFLFTRDENGKVVPIKKPRVKFVIPYTAFGEICDFATKPENAIFKDDFKEVLCKTMLRFNDSKRNDMGELVSDIRSLARAYINNYEFRGKTFKAPMKDYVTGRIPSDSMIMAEATVHGLNLLTFNGKDFVFDEENQENISGRSRKYGICAINEKMGYKKYYKNADGEMEKVLPRPYQFGLVMRKFMNKDGVSHDFDFRVKPKTKRIEHNEIERVSK